MSRVYDHQRFCTPFGNFVLTVPLFLLKSHPYGVFIFCFLLWLLILFYYGGITSNSVLKPLWGLFFTGWILLAVSNYLQDWMPVGIGEKFFKAEGKKIQLLNHITAVFKFRWIFFICTSKETSNFQALILRFSSLVLIGLCLISNAFLLFYSPILISLWIICCVACSRVLYIFTQCECMTIQ